MYQANKTPSIMMTPMTESSQDEITYAKLFKPSEFEGKRLEDLPFFDCDYLFRCIEGPFCGKQVRLRDFGNQIIIGSKENDCNFYLEDSEVSPKHCKLTYVENSFYYIIEDCRSKTGTWMEILTMEDSYEIPENTDFILFNHEFSLIYVKEKEDSDIHCILKFTKGPLKSKTIPIKKDTTFYLEKKEQNSRDEPDKLFLELDGAMNSIKIKIISNDGKIFIIDETKEYYEGGLFFRVNKQLVRAGDCFKIGKSYFKILSFNYGFFNELGDRQFQEDRYILIDDLRISEEIIMPYFAVYDGHGGNTCSEFVKQYLHNELHYFLKRDEIINSTNFLPDLVETIQKVIILVDINYYDSIPNFSVNHGSTCVFVFFIGTYLLCCNLGDSISILLKRGYIKDGKKESRRIYLSRDFNPSREKEKQRITYRKGFITNDGRLLGTISVSRSFGDWKYKDKTKQKILKKNQEFDEYLISNRAEFRLLELNPNADKYVILASDGVFQNKNHKTWCNILYNYLDQEKEVDGTPFMPFALDKFRLELIKNNQIDPNLKGSADNMTLIAIKLFNDK